MAKEQFIDALISSDMRLRIKQARPTSLNMAVWHAVELEAFNKAEKMHIEGHGFMWTVIHPETSSSSTDLPTTDFRELKETMMGMQKTRETLSRQNRPRFGGNNGPTQNFIRPGFVPRPNLIRPGFVPRPGDKTQNTKRKCYTCGSEKHIHRNFPQNKG